MLNKFLSSFKNFKGSILHSAVDIISALLIAVLILILTNALTSKGAKSNNTDAGTEVSPAFSATETVSEVAE